MSHLKQHGNVTVVTIDQPLRQEEAESLSLPIEASFKMGVPQVVIDLAQTPLIDGAGLEWLEDLDIGCADLGGCIRLCNANELCVDILRMTGTGDRLEQFPTLTAALASFVR